MRNANGGRLRRLVGFAAGGNDRGSCHGNGGFHTDDTPIAVLAPGLGRTRTGRTWVYLIDERAWSDGRARAAYYRFSPDRKGERPRDHLASFRGVIQADAFSGYEALYRQPGPPDANVARIMYAACWSHARRKLFYEFERTKSADR